MKGGLGNQMFQYAVGFCLSNKFSERLYLDLTDYRKQNLRNFELYKVFGINNKEANLFKCFYYQLRNKIDNLTGFSNQRIYSETSFAFDSNIFTEPHATYFKGFFQSYKYFAEIVPEVRKQFTFIGAIDKTNQATASHIKATNSVSIHIRRGDYLYWNEFDSSHVLCPLPYYEKAIMYIQEQVEECTFFVFTDDPLWVRENLEFEYFLIEGNNGENSWKDMYLMSLCKHHIIANSTFSWWGAWLNTSSEKIVIAPEIWFGNEMNKDTTDLCPPEWIRM